MTVDMSQFFDVFFEESQEHLDEMEHLLMELSLDNPDIEDLNSIFRAAHSIKGGSGVFGFDALTGLTHVMENILDLARNDEIVMTKVIVDRLLITVDTLKNILQCYQNESEIDWEAIEVGTVALEQLLNTGDAQGANETEATEDQIEGFGMFEHPVTNDDDEFGFFDPVEQAPQETAYGFYENEAKADDNAKPSQNAATTEESADGFGFFDEQPSSNQVSEKQLVSASKGVKATNNVNVNVSALKPKGGSKKAGTTKAKADAKESSSIRVDTLKIDSLVNLVGELVITQSMIKIVGKEVQGETEEKLEGAIGELSRNIREIQEAVMSMRMLPMSFAFNRFPRVVRDLADKLGKDVNLVIEGGATEIDKGMIEKLVDPLTHLIRNSVDHGIEMPDVRKAAGKTANGTVILGAEQRGGSIIITITDDGAGLNREKILEKAINNGLDVPPDAPDSKIWSLIFEAGFSTAEAVTDVSGRGVGMDVVRRNIESVGGFVEIESHQGVGSIFKIRLPLTLAIVDGMCVSVGKQTYVIPLTNIIESMQPTQEQLKTLANDQVLWVRGEYWPLVQMHKLMGIEGAKEKLTDGIVVLVETSRKRFGILVDDLEGQQQVVIKSLEQHYRRVPGVAGATIMGDGSVAMILDIESIASGVDNPSKLEVPIAS